MTKRKLEKFSEFSSFPHTFEISGDVLFKDGFPLKGKWREEFFKNDNPITLELACGKAEYTVALSQLFPQNNYIGIDIKGARMWRGAKTTYELGLKNVAFIRTYIDWIDNFFDKDEVDEIWITFPDPYPAKSKERKRLTSPFFIEKYKKIAKKGTFIHLKTDNENLFNYTLEVINSCNLSLCVASNDIYTDFPNDAILGIKTYYEEMWLKEGKKIHYLKYQI